MAALFGAEPHALTYSWQKLYHQALVEPDVRKMREHVAAAELAITERLLALSNDPNHQVERQAIQDALASLRVLKAETL